jgi:hypothetical protein
MYGFRRGLAGVGALAIALLAGSAQAATLEAQYFFTNNFNSNVAGAPALTPVDPTATSMFATDTVLGSSRTVYNFNGNASPASQQGGLSFDNSGGLLPSNSYSVDLVFKFSGGTGAWRRILDVQNRQSDNGFYVDPSNNLDVFPVVGGGGSAFTTGVYHNVALTVASTGDVTAYLDGIAAFTTNTAVMNINNPANLVNLFLDNVVAGGQGEWSSGDIALADFFNGVLSAADVAALNLNPFGPAPPPGTVPEPASILLLGAGLAGMGLARRKQAQGTHC